MARFSNAVLVWSVRSDAVLRRPGRLGSMVVDTHRTRTRRHSLCIVLAMVEAITRRATMEDKAMVAAQEARHCLENPGLTVLGRGRLRVAPRTGRSRRGGGTAARCAAAA